MGLKQSTVGKMGNEYFLSLAPWPTTHGWLENTIVSSPSGETSAPSSEKGRDLAEVRMGASLGILREVVSQLITNSTVINQQEIFPLTNQLGVL